MVDFYLKKVDVLLCTTIIESGLDVPSANTIIIDRADTLGLAQLYQLRGRVGRDKYRAFAYLLVPADGGMSEVARKRLQVIAELTELGSGFKIAARDLEIRGAGNLLGAEQSGHIAAVGFDLYTQLIQETVRELKGEPTEVEVEPTIRLRAEGFIPESYVPDPALRLNLYKRLAALRETPTADRFRRRAGGSLRAGPARGGVAAPGDGPQDPGAGAPHSRDRRPAGSHPGALRAGRRRSARRRS